MNQAHGTVMEVDQGGIAVIHWGVQGLGNLLNPPAIEAFSAAVQAVLNDPAVKGAIVTSPRPSFLEGLDLEWLYAASAPDGGRDAPERLSDEISRLHAVLRRLETGRKPFVAAVNGTALGAGLELCLACHRRIVADLPDIRLGFPDVKIGLPTVAGASQRLPRMIGVPPALALLLDGRLLSPRDAQEAGVVDDLVPPNELLPAARCWIASVQPSPPAKPWDGPRPVTAEMRVSGGEFSAASAKAAREASDRDLGRNPAPSAIRSAVAEGMSLSIETGLRIEAQHFVECACDPVTRSMVRTQGINLARVNSLARRPRGFARRNFRRLGVLGAGLMGVGIASVAAKAGICVRLIDVSHAAAERGREQIERQMQADIRAGRVSRAAAEAALRRIEPTANYDALRDVDIVIEAVFEDRAVKAEATRRAEAAMPSDAVFGTNTSTLPITALAEASSRPELFIGLHFFSPVPRMPLLEIIRGRLTTDETLAAAMDFAKAIDKTPIVVRDSRGFYTSRVIMTYQAEAFIMLAEGVAPARIEQAGIATGMPLPPLALADAVALDLIHQINVETKRDLGSRHRETAAERVVATMVIEHGRTGKKARKGFYDYPSGEEKRLWPELARVFPEAESQPGLDELAERLLGIQALETARCLEEGVLSDPAEADVGAVLGWGFAPWTGGPLSYIDLKGPGRFVATCEQLADRYGDRFRPNEMLRRLARGGRSVYGQSG